MFLFLKSAFKLLHKTRLKALVDQVFGLEAMQAAHHVKVP